MSILFHKHILYLKYVRGGEGMYLIRAPSKKVSKPKPAN